MKKVFLTIAVAALFMFGCQDQNSIVEPVSSKVQQTQNNHQWLAFAENQKSSIEDLFHFSKLINGAYGGSFSFSNSGSFSSYRSRMRNVMSKIYIKGSLIVPIDAYEGTKDIGVILNSETVTADFSPSPSTFNKPILFTIEYSGVDLTGINPDNIDFYYIDVKGNLVKAQYSSIKVDVSTGFLAVYDAQLPHFSRYGFVN